MRRSAMVLAIGAAAACGRTTEVTPAVPSAPLIVARHGAELAPLVPSKADVAPVTVTAYDPYYARTKTFRALPLGPLLERAFGASSADLAKEEWLIKAKDGYAVPISGARLFEDGAHLAFADVDAPGWEPIGPQRANPGPYYLVWSKEGQQDLAQYPRPWQVARLEIAPFESIYPHVVPTGAAPDSPAARGFALFKAQCIRCHMINREGGSVGPELNVPQSVVEYREKDYLRAFIRNPWQFRYGAMPPQSHLTDAQLDELLAYFEAMRASKHDPQAERPAEAH